MVPDGVKGGNFPKAMVSLAVSLGQLSTRNPGSQDDGRRERQPKEQEIRSFYKRCQAKRCPGLADSLTPHGMNFWQEFAQKVFISLGKDSQLAKYAPQNPSDLSHSLPIPSQLCVCVCVCT